MSEGVRTTMANFGAMDAPGTTLRSAVHHAWPWLQDIAPEKAYTPLGPGKWSAKEIIGHLLDSANNNLARFVRLQATTDLYFEAYAQEEWVRLQAYAQADWSDLVELWAREVKEVDADLLKRLEQNNPASLPNQYVIIYNHAGRIVYQSDVVQPISVVSTFIKAIGVQKEVWLQEHHFEVVGFQLEEHGAIFTVIAAASDVFGNDALHNLRNILIVIFMISVVLVSLLGWFYAGRVLSPINRIVREVSTITELNLTQRLDEGPNNDELSNLARAFNGLLIRLRGVFHAQRFFIANASHELKTPITAMTGVIEVGLMQERDNSYYQNLLRTTLHNLDRLNRLSNQLLLLAQTSSQSPEKNFRPLRVDDIFWDGDRETIPLC